MKWKRFGRRMKIMLLITFLIWSMLTPAFHFTQAEQGQLPEDMNSREMEQQEPLNKEVEQNELEENNEEKVDPETSTGEMEKTEKEQGDTEDAPVEDAKPLKQGTKKIKDFTAENKIDIENESEEEQEPKSNQVQQMNVQAMNVDDFVYTDNGDGTATITGYNGNATDLNIPATLGGLTVTSIGDSAFRDMGLETVVISDSVRNIGKWAFMNNSLTTVTIPHGVKNLDNFVFADNALTSINLPDSLETIGYYSFYNNNLSTVTIPENVGIIDIGAFRNNDLEHVTIPDGVETIEALAFENNYLTSIDLSSRLTTIEASAFEKNRLREVIIPDSVTSIGEGAFSWNQLTEVVIPKSVTSIGAGAFEYNQMDSADFTIYGYENLVAKTYANRNGHTFINMVTLPENIYEWEDNGDGTATITGYSGSATDIKIPETLGGLTVAGIGANAFQNNGLESVIIPNSVTRIGNTAFAGNQLTKVVIPDSVTSIGSWAFRNNNLREVVISDSVSRIGDWTFAGNQLTKVVIPNSVTIIESWAFFSNQLTEVVIPDSVTFIGGYVFGSNQSNLADLTIYGFEDSVAKTYANRNGHTFINMVTLPENIYEWEDNGDGTATITGYSGSATDIDIPATIGGLTVTSIGNSAFSSKQLTEVVIPDGVTSIGNYAFYNNQLSEVDIPDGVINIGNWAFASNALTTVDIPESVTSIGSHVFSSNQLTSIEIPNGVTSIGNLAFESNQLIEVIIPESVTSIGINAFAGNQSTPADFTIYGYEDSAAKTYANRNGHTFINMTTLPEDIYEWKENRDGTAAITGYKGSAKELDIPKTLGGLTVTSIASMAFNNKGLTKVIIPDSVTSIEERAFSNNNLTEVVISNSVMTIGYLAFSNNNLTEVIIPNSVTSLGGESFSNNQLTEIVIPNSVTYIGHATFWNNNLTKVVIPDSVTSIWLLAFADNQLTEVIIPDSVTNIGSTAFENNQSNPSDLTIYGYESSEAETQATTNDYQFKALDSPPVVDIHFNDEPLKDLLSEDSFLSVDYEAKGELKATYSHELEDHDFVKLEIENVSWKIAEVSDLVEGDTLELASYTNSVSKRTVTLTVETNYGGKSIKEFTLDIRPPVPNVSDLTIDEITETSITLSWGGVDYADEYVLKRDGIEVYRGSSASYTDTGLKPNISYTYSLVAVNDTGASDVSTQTAKTNLPVPEMPTLSIESTTETSISLSWDEVDYAEEYVLERDGIEVYRGSSTSYTDTGLKPNISYTYSLVAVNDTGASNASTQTAKTNLLVPEMPTLSIESTTETSITLSWNEVDYAEEYILKRDGSEVYRGTEKEFNDTELNSNTSYRYSLVAVNNSGTSEKLQITGTTDLPEPQPEEFEVKLDLDLTEETDGPVTIKVSTTSEADITSLKWVPGDRIEADFVKAGNEIDLETMAFTVEENGTYTIYALNANGVAALATITISNITDLDGGTDSIDGTDSDDNGKTLPSTATNLFNLLIMGVIMLVIGFTFIIFRRKQNA